MKKKKQQKKANCTANDIKNDKYTLDFKTADKNTYILQSAISINDKEILLVNIKDIENYEDDGATLEPYKEDDVQSIRYFSKRSKGIGPGAIVGIVLACVVALASVIAAILCLRKSPNHAPNNNSDLENIKNII